MIDWANHDSLHVGLWTDGLCARLRSLSGVAAVAQIVGKPFSVAWSDEHPACPAKLDKLLTGNWKSVDHPPEGSLDTNGVIPQCARGTEYYQLVKDRLSRKDFIEVLLAIRASWKPVEAIQVRIDRLRELHGPFEKMIGLHVRRTDMNPWLAKDKWVVPDWGWAHIAKSRMKGAGLTQTYVATCCGDTHVSLRERIGDAFVSNGSAFDTKAEGDTRQTTVAAAVVDMCVLSQCYKVYATPRSSFSHYVGSLIPCPQHRFRFVTSMTPARRAESCRGSR